MFKSLEESTLQGNLTFKRVIKICLQVNIPLILICTVRATRMKGNEYSF
jgi:Cys-tRNA synthase (O-phospho-L-seryl-tRNA:Cys-tRNA synthase)